MEKTGESGFSLSNMIVLGQLGRGGTSHVFRAQSTRSKRLYAMKVIDKKARSYHRPALEKELAIHGRLSHPAVVRLEGHIEDSDNHYVLTEYCEGGEMTRLLAQPLSEEVLAAVIWQVAVGLAYLHEEGVVHCDLKLSNLLLQQGHIKICDFGFSQSISESNPTEKPICGTIYYMAPEILKEKRRIYYKEGDVWALGICLLILITKKQPYSGECFQQLRKQIIAGEREKLPPLSSDLENLMKRLLEMNHNARITIEEVLAHPFLAKHSTRLTNPIILATAILHQPKISKVEQVTSLPSQNEAEEPESSPPKTTKQECQEWSFKRSNKKNQVNNDSTIQRKIPKPQVSDNEKTIRQIRKKEHQTKYPQQTKSNQKNIKQSLPPENGSLADSPFFDARLIKPFEQFHYQTKNDGFINIAKNGLVSIKVKTICFQISPDGQVLFLNNKRYSLKEIQANPLGFKQHLDLYRYAKQVIQLLKQKQYSATWRERHGSTDLLLGISLDWKHVKCIWQEEVSVLLEWKKGESWINVRIDGGKAVKKEIGQLGAEAEIFSIMKGHLCPPERQDFQ